MLRFLIWFILLKCSDHKVIYSLLILTSLWHEHISWRHCTQRKNISQCSSIWCHSQTEKNEDKVGISKSTFRHNFANMFQLSRIFEEVLETLFMHSVPKDFSGKNVWLFARWEVKSCLLNILLTKSYKLLYTAQQSRIF